MSRRRTLDNFQVVGADESSVGEIYQEAVRTKEVSSQNALSNVGDDETPGIILKPQLKFDVASAKRFDEGAVGGNEGLVVWPSGFCKAWR